ncbi:uncharacterized protein B0H64DRAFT_412660 [Chaetomium fimeti]|uniref:Uncharacterized protein n=1 Tax=Chaetomium fimeti TaxID=1854472 RepID=A0AAE0H632_9PEZI|nr:hypothetical protein B0H64DRAFT_412660 [Chaetomium fimeti]
MPATLSCLVFIHRCLCQLRLSLSPLDSLSQTPRASESREPGGRTGRSLRPLVLPGMFRWIPASVPGSYGVSVQLVTSVCPCPDRVNRARVRIRLYIHPSGLLGLSQNTSSPNFPQDEPDALERAGLGWGSGCGTPWRWEICLFISENPGRLQFDEDGIRTNQGADVMVDSSTGPLRRIMGKGNITLAVVRFGNN